MLQDRLPPKTRPGRQKPSKANALKARARELGASDLFAYKDPQELAKYLENYGGSEKTVAYIIHGLTVNMMAMKFAQLEAKNVKTQKPKKRSA